MSFLIALYLQAAVATTPDPAPEQPSAVAGVTVPSPKAKARAKVYTPTYKAAPHLAPTSAQISGAATVSNAFFNDVRFRSSTLSALTISNYAAQRFRAKKAADLINAGHCPEALQAVFNEGDALLTTRVAEVCELPTPLAERGGPPF